MVLNRIGAKARLSILYIYINIFSALFYAAFIHLLYIPFLKNFARVVR